MVDRCKQFLRMTEQGLVGNLAPLDMPPIPSTSGSHGPNGQAETLQASYGRLQALLDVLILMLAYVKAAPMTCYHLLTSCGYRRTPTERPVPVPIAVLVKLCQRMLNLTIYSPLKERHDTALRTAQLALLPGLHTNACRLLAQIITRYAFPILTLLSCQS